VLGASAIAGAIWVFGLCVITLMSSPAVIAAAVAYALIFGVALALERLPTVLTLIAAWATAVVAASAFYQAIDVEVEVGAVILLGGAVGTFLFGAWVVPGFFILLLLDPEMRRSPTEHRG
jgi:hypothetical protein